ncbi:Uncharacterized protein FWK35_00035760, partial [Aphis craccivora]
MSRPPNSPVSPKVKNKPADKIKTDKNIQAARLIKNTTNNSMMNPTNSNSSLEYDNMHNNMDVGWTQKVNKRNHSDSSDPKSPPPTSNKKNNNNKLFVTANRYEVLTQIEPATPAIPDSNQAFYSSAETANNVNPIKPPPPIFVKESHPLLETNHPSTLPPTSSQRTYAHATSNQSRDSNHPPPVLDFDKKMSSFLDEFISVINPLIKLLTK